MKTGNAILFQKSNLHLTLLLFLISFSTYSQDRSLAFPDSYDSIPQVAHTLSFGAKQGTVNIYKDERIGKIEAFIRAGEETLEGVKIDGYRVLIFFDMSKTVAEQQKAYFLTLYPDQKAYVDYLAPNYRVRVGNFRTELEAEKLKQELLPLFPTALVVSDKIQLPVLEQNNTSKQGN